MSTTEQRPTERPAPAGAHQPQRTAADDGPGASPTARTAWLARLLPELAWAAASAGFALLGVGAVLRLWKAHLNIPLSTAGDVMLSLMVVKNMQTTGWFQTTPELGAPYGQNLAAYPSSVGDLWHQVTLKVLSLFLSPAATVNVFYVGGYAVIAVFAYVALRRLTVSRPIACALAVTYSLAPYHFLRGESHLLLSAYYALPVAVVLAVSIYQDRSKVVSLPWRMPAAGWAGIAGAVLLAGTGLYYAAFSIVIIAASGVLASIASRRLRPFLSAVLLSAVITAGLALAALPNLLFKGLPGASAVEGRSYGATEFYGLKITNLLLPFGLHRIGMLADLRANTADSPIPGEGSETLGILGAVGLVLVVVAVLLPRVRGRLRLWDRLEPLGVLTVVAILCGTVAGLNSLAAALGYAELRAWNRISILIAFMALAGLGLALDSLLRRWSERRPRVVSLAAVGLAGVLMAIAVFDQTSDALIPNYPAAAAGWNSDTAYFTALQKELGPGSTVFTLPYAPFPENPPIVNMADYSHLRGYLHSDLKWSYGGVKGQESEWQPVALQGGVPAALPRLVAAGFQAVYVNRLGYADRGAAVEAAITSVIGPQAPLVSSDGLLATYDLRPYAARLRDENAVPAASSVLLGPRIDVGKGAYPEEQGDGVRWYWTQQTAVVEIVNPTDRDEDVRLTGTVAVATPGATVRFVADGRVTALTTRADGTAELGLTAHVPARSSADVGISTDSAPTPGAAGDPRSLYARLINLDVTVPSS